VGSLEPSRLRSLTLSLPQGFEEKHHFCPWYLKKFTGGCRYKQGLHIEIVYFLIKK
jgi:hypothetical protein